MADRRGNFVMSFGLHKPGSRALRFAWLLIVLAAPIAARAEFGTRGHTGRSAERPGAASGQANKHSGARAQERALPSMLQFSTTTPDGKSVPVDGIVCDNLRDTPSSQKNFLELTLPRQYAGCSVDGVLANPDGTVSDTS